MGNKNKCIFLKKIWLEVEDDGGNTVEELTLTCSNEESIDYKSEVLDTKNCKEDYCSLYKEN